MHRQKRGGEKKRKDSCTVTSARMSSSRDVIGSLKKGKREGKRPESVTANGRGKKGKEAKRPVGPRRLGPVVRFEHIGKKKKVDLPFGAGAGSKKGKKPCGQAVSPNGKREKGYNIFKPLSQGGEKEGGGRKHRT